MSEPTDDRKLLLAYHRDGSHEAFGQLVGKYSPMVFQTALRRTRDHQLAEDVTQAVFIVLARRAGTLKSHESIAGWLHQTAIFASSSALRAQARQRKHESAAAKPEAMVHPQRGESTEVAATTEEELHRLPAIHRNVLVLHYLEGKTIPQAAEILGLSHEAARKRLSRALEKLRIRLSRRGFTAEPTGIVSALGAVPIVSAETVAGKVIAAAFAGGDNGSAFTLAADLIRLIKLNALRNAAAVLAISAVAAGSIGVAVAQSMPSGNSVITTTAPQQPLSAGRPLPSQTELRRALEQLRTKVSSARVDLESDIVLERPGTDAVWPTNYKAQSSFSIQTGDQWFFHTKVESQGIDRVQIRAGDVVSTWNRYPTGPGTGIIRAFETGNDDVEFEMKRILPHQAPFESFSFDPLHTDFKISKWVVRNGRDALQIEWDAGSLRCSALLDPLRDYLPVLVERRNARDESLLDRTEWEDYEHINGTFVARVMHVYSTVVAGAYRKMHPPLSLAGADDDETLRRNETFRLTGVHLNVELPADQFEMVWLPGTDITDRLRGIKYYWKPGGLDAQDASLSTPTYSARPHGNVTGPSMMDSGRRWWMILIGCLGVGSGFVIWALMCISRVTSTKSERHK